MKYYLFILYEVVLFSVMLSKSFIAVRFGVWGFYLALFVLLIGNTFIILNAGNISRSIYCKMKGTSFFPLYIFPIVILRTARCKYKVKMTGICKECFRIILPPEILKDTLLASDVTDQKPISTTFINSLHVQFLGRMLGIGVVCGFEFYLFRSALLFFYGAGLVVLLVLMSKLGNIDYYVGEQWIIREFKNKSELFEDYCASQISYYPREEQIMYSKYQDILLQRESLIESEWCFYNLMHMFVLDYNGKITISNELDLRIEKFTAGQDFVQGASWSWYMNTSCLVWSVLKNKKRNVETFVNVVLSMKRVYDRIPFWIMKVIRNNFFQWHYDLAKSGIYSRNIWRYPKYRLLMRDSLYHISDEYKSCYKKFHNDFERILDNDKTR